MQKSDHGDDDLVQALLDTRKEPSREQLKSIVRAVREAGGTIVTSSHDPADGPWCGTGVQVPWPPSPKLWELLEQVIANGGVFGGGFPLGIPAPTHFLVTFRVRGAGG